MKNFRLFLLFVLVAVGAWAKPAVCRDNVPAQTETEQRRAELRAALKAPRTREVPSKDQTLDKEPLNRHLSAQERADLRQQLRQQRLDAKLDHP